MQIDREKHMIRAEMKEKRNSIAKVTAVQWSGEICRALQEQPFFKEAGTVCFYYPLGSEVNLLPLAKQALVWEKHIAFPRVLGSDMEFYRVSDLKEFAEGAFHVMEPTGGNVVCIEDALVFVPGLVFDEYGSRMGYGKGYYDKYFARYPDCFKIGICYEMQMIPEVPCNKYDASMNKVVTEQGVYDCDDTKNNRLNGRTR